VELALGVGVGCTVGLGVGVAVWPQADSRTANAAIRVNERRGMRRRRGCIAAA
jgi:hypothetical protein